MVPAKVKKLLEENNLAVKKQYGQNFLVDDNIIQNICDKAEITKDISVIEIGPGLGSLTDVIANKCKKLICYEIDKGLANILKDRYKDSNVEIIEADFLKRDIETDINTYFQKEDIYVISNLPYYITTNILVRLIETKKYYKRLVLMMQKEVADRICGKSGTKDYNSLSVFIQFYAKAKPIIQVPPTCFYPAPDVNSTVVCFDIYNKPLYNVIDEEYFNKFTRLIFSQKRKTLVNNLKTSKEYNFNDIEYILEKNKLSKTVRSEELSIEQIADLANDFYEVLNK